MHESNIITVNSLLLLGTIALGAKSAYFFFLQVVLYELNASLVHTLVL